MHFGTRHPPVSRQALPVNAFGFDSHRTSTPPGLFWGLRQECASSIFATMNATIHPKHLRALHKIGLFLSSIQNAAVEKKENKEEGRLLALGFRWSC
jgi:hypothetical protein